LTALAGDYFAACGFFCTVDSEDFFYSLDRSVNILCNVMLIRGLAIGLSLVRMCNCSGTEGGV